MYTATFRLNLIKIITMALVIAFILFAAFSDESALGFKSDNTPLTAKMNNAAECICLTQN